MHAAGDLAATGRPGRHRLLLVLLLWQPFARTAAAAALLWRLLAALHRGHAPAWDVLPDGGASRRNNLAYIDGGHLNATAPESLRDDGLGALQLTLMRNGYLPLLLSK